MAYVYKRGNKWWCRIKQAGKWIGKPTPYRVDDPNGKRYAKRVADKAQDLVDRAGGRDATGDQAVPSGALTVERWAKTFITKRRETHEADPHQYRDWKTDEGRLNNHVIPRIGHLRLEAVRPRDLAEFVHDLRTKSKPKLAPHTIRNVYGIVAAMFRDAAVAGHIDATPCILDKTELGMDRYVDEDAQAECRYSRDQLESLISDPRIEEHGRMFVALGGLAGLRLGEIAGLRVSDLDTTARPLWRLKVATTYDGRATKTLKTRMVPVHPTLQRLLESWFRFGFARTFGRAPTPSDPIVPRAPRKWSRAGSAGRPHTEKTGGDLMDRCLAAIGLPKPAKKTHALRSTFISLAIEDGASDYQLERVTHTTKSKSGRAFDLYNRPAWEALCSEVSKLRVTVRVTVVDFSTEKFVEAAGVEATTNVDSCSLAITSSSANDNANEHEREGASLQLSHRVTRAILDGDLDLARRLLDSSNGENRTRSRR